MIHVKNGHVSERDDFFISIGRGELVPYASLHMVGLMMVRPVVVLRRHLTALGFECRVGVYEAEDHAGALCETMSLIISRGHEIAFDIQRQFFIDHIGPLGEQFLEVEKQYRAMLNKSKGDTTKANVLTCSLAEETIMLRRAKSIRTNRRAFLKEAAVMGGVTTSLVIAGRRVTALPEGVEMAAPSEKPKGYHLTPHMQRYYESARM